MENNRVEEMLNTVEKVMLLICGNNEPGIAVFDICKKNIMEQLYNCFFSRVCFKGGIQQNIQQARR